MSTQTGKKSVSPNTKKKMEETRILYQVRGKRTSTARVKIFGLAAFPSIETQSKKG